MYPSLSDPSSTEPAALPVITLPPGTVEVMEGEEVNLECGVEGNPAPVVRWERTGGSPLPNSSIVLPSGTLRLSSASHEDAGVYLCSASNSQGDVSAAGHVIVKGKLEGEGASEREWEGEGRKGERGYIYVALHLSVTHVHRMTITCTRFCKPMHT